MSAKLTTNVDQRLLRTTKFPAEFNTKVDMKKINIHIIKKWVSDELARLLKGEDDVVTELVFNIIEENRFPNIKELQVQLSGFLDKDAASFCHELWKLCLSAQSNPQGIPKELLEAKKSELIQERIEEERAREEATRRQEAEREREREMDRLRDRERNRRGRGGDRYGRDSDRRPPRDSRSPPRRRRRDDDDFSRPTRGADTWAPSRRDDRAPRRRPSPSYGRSPDRSRTPPRRRRRSSTPPASRSRSRRRRNTSSERSSSPDQRRRKNGRDHLRSPRRRSSPPSKRIRRASPSPAASQRDRAADPRPNTSSSASSAPKVKEAPKDLLSRTKTSKEGRLSRQPEEHFCLGAAERARQVAETEQDRGAMTSTP